MTVMYAGKATMVPLKTRNEFFVFLAKLNFESLPFVRDSAGDDARNRGMDPWQCQDKKLVSSFFHLFVHLFVGTFT